MKIFGYSDNTNEEPMVLKEMTISADPESLREISRFLLNCADEIENNMDWEHKHFAKQNGDENGSPELVVFNPHAKLQNT